MGGEDVSMDLLQKALENAPDAESKGALENTIGNKKDIKVVDTNKEKGEIVEGKTEITHDMIANILLELPSENNAEKNRKTILAQQQQQQPLMPPPQQQQQQQQQQEEEEKRKRIEPIRTNVGRSTSKSGTPTYQLRPTKKDRSKRQKLASPENGARAVRSPPNKDFSIGLEKPLVESLAPGGQELTSLHLQKLKDATQLLQKMNIHVLEPLTLYTKMELYELMASVAEVWKNSGKAAWKKRINKIKGNARSRKAPRNSLDEKEKKEIASLEEKIRMREIWEEHEKFKLSQGAAAAKLLQLPPSYTPQSTAAAGGAMIVKKTNKQKETSSKSIVPVPPPSIPAPPQQLFTHSHIPVQYYHPQQSFQYIGNNHFQ